MARRQRLDLRLVELGLVSSRQQAQQLIRAGKVRLGDAVLDKPGHEIPLEAQPLVTLPPRFVSRGGEKLAAALKERLRPPQARQLVPRSLPQNTGPPRTNTPTEVSVKLKVV